MWDPFRYKLGGRLLNRNMEEFTARYGTAEDGKYVLARDLATYAITKEVEAGRGSPHGGVYLSFEHCAETTLRSAFGPVIDRLAANGIDLTKTPVEVAPIAHYHMGGVVADALMATEVPGLFVAGEAVGGANGANRLSGNAITEALVFGRQAGRSAAARAKRMDTAPVSETAARSTLDILALDGSGGDNKGRANVAEMVQRLQATMADDVGPFRDGLRLTRGLETIDGLTRDLGERPAGTRGAFDMQRLDWLDLRNMLVVARSVAQAALARTESRGAHQREDHPEMRTEWQNNQILRWRDGLLTLTRAERAPAETSA
jgi:succinate dehydrogenase/fumarate reductase flavoprotein subunit